MSTARGQSAPQSSRTSHLDGIAARALAAAGAATVELCTAGAVGRLDGAILLVIAAATVLAISLPDTHVGLVLAIVMGVGWILRVDDVSTWWSAGAGGGMVLFHSGLAATSIAPPGTAWPSSARRRWGRRITAVTASILVLAATAELARAIAPAESTLLVATSVVALSIAATWAASHEPRRSEHPRGR